MGSSGIINCADFGTVQFYRGFDFPFVTFKSCRQYCTSYSSVKLRWLRTAVQLDSFTLFVVGH